MGNQFTNWVKQKREEQFFARFERTGKVEEVPNELIRDKPFALRAIKQGANLLDLLGEKLKDDREVVLRAVENEPLSFEYASERLRGDYQIIHTALKKHPQAFEFVAPEAKRLIMIVVRDMRKNGPLMTNILEYEGMTQEEVDVVDKIAYIVYGSSI